MKLRLTLKTTTKKDKKVVLKLNVAPSKHIGFINFINLALEQGTGVEVAFEKISKSGEREESKIAGAFKFDARKDAEKQLKQWEEEVLEREQKRKKQLQKRKPK
jgi:hypothetical protein